MNKKKLKKSYRKLGIKAGDTIYITGNFGKLGFFEESNKIQNLVEKKNHTLKKHYEVLQEVLGDKGTICFPTHSWALAKNKNSIFSINNTPCDHLFSEYMRANYPHRRQFHPYASISAIGKNSKKIINNQQKLPYGKKTPFDNIARLNGKHISIGMKSHNTATQVHHCEFLANVPYRYVKEFNQKCLINGKIVKKKFELFVIREDFNITRDNNEKIFNSKGNKNLIKKIKFNRGFIEIFNIKKFINNTTKVIIKNPYIWLREKPYKKS